MLFKKIIKHEIFTMLDALSSFKKLLLTPLDLLEIELEQKQSTRFCSNEWNYRKKQHKILKEIESKLQATINDIEILENEINFAIQKDCKNRVDWFHKN